MAEKKVVKKKVTKNKAAAVKIVKQKKWYIYYPAIALNYVLLGYKKVKAKIMHLLCFIIVPPNRKEGISQFVLRQILIPDSTGRPSWTVSITAYILVLITYISYYEIKLSQTMVRITNGNSITEHVKGFSSEFWGILLTLTISITYLYRARSRDISNGGIKGHNTKEVSSTVEESMGEPTMVDTVIDKVKGFIK